MTTCPICLETIRQPTQTRCGHVYCSPCIDRWRLTNDTCPYCRKYLYLNIAKGTTVPISEYDQNILKNLFNISNLSIVSESNLELLDNYVITSSSSGNIIYRGTYVGKDSKFLFLEHIKVYDRCNNISYNASPHYRSIKISDKKYIYRYYND